MTTGWRDHMIMWSKDVGRSVDYLESRPDMAKDRIGYMGVSWGAEIAPLFLAVEPRISLAVLYIGGFNRQPSLPEADPVNFAPRVKVPVLMLNGRFDFFYPDGNLARADVQTARHPCRTQDGVSCTRRHTDPAQRDDQGSGGLDGEVLGTADALAVSRTRDSGSRPSPLGRLVVALDVSPQGRPYKDESHYPENEGFNVLPRTVAAARARPEGWSPVKGTHRGTRRPVPFPLRVSWRINTGPSCNVTGSFAASWGCR